MSTREWRSGRTAARRRASGSLCLLLVVSGAAVGSANGLPTAAPQVTEADAGPAVADAVASAARNPDPVAHAVSLGQWATALTSGTQPAVARPFEAAAPIPTSVPRAALAGYGRAASVLAHEVPSCALDWSLLAAIGHVESDHGRRAASTLGSDGVSRPGIVGPAIDVPGRRSVLTDTDGGELDETATEDRAVGALQLLPSAWSAAAVDGDGDGVRNPQDVDDASLAAGVLLCTSSPGLGSEAGLRQALRHYNPAHGYVNTVRRLAAAYAVTDLMAAVVATAIDVVAGPAQLARVSAAPEAPAVVSDTSATPGVTPSARETVPASARPVSASATADPQATTSAMPSPVSASIAADATTPSAGPAAPPSAPPSQQADDPPSVTAAGANPQPDPAPEPEPTRASAPEPEPTRGPDPGPEPSPEPTRDPAPEPTPSRDPANSPSPSPEPGAGESAAPETSTAPDLRTVSGVWSRDGGSFLLDGTVVVGVDALGDLAAPAPVDLDGDGATETVVEELTGLAGSTVEVHGIASPGRVAPASLDDLRVLP